MEFKTLDLLGNNGNGKIRILLSVRNVNAVISRYKQLDQERFEL